MMVLEDDMARVLDNNLERGDCFPGDCMTQREEELG